MPLKEVAKTAEKRAIERAIVRNSGNKSKASKMLKINYKTLLYKIKEYHIRNGTDYIERIP
jgi:DNA-binding NtrC family response regulator